MKNNTVGAKIQSLREAQNLSVEELAANASLTIEQLTRIETDEVLPSLAPLLKVARALGVRLGTFLDDQDETGPVVCRKDEREGSTTFSTGAITGKHMEYHSLSKSKLNRHMEPFIIDVAPASDGGDMSSHEGEEFIFVMDGEVEIVYGNKTYRLSQGDSMYYDSIVPHHVHSFSKTSAKILAVVYTPI